MRPIKIQETKTSQSSEMLEMKSGSVKDMERYGKDMESHLSYLQPKWKH